MAGKGSGFWALVTALLIFSSLAGGCRQERTPQAKQARLIAAESMQLKGRLADLEARMDQRQTRYASDMRQLKGQLAASRKLNESLRKDLQNGIAERVNSVTVAVMGENATLRREIQQLRAEIEKLEARLSEAP